MRLQADLPREGKGWAILKGSRDWDEAVEYSWRRQVHQAALAEIETRCPFLHAAPAAAAPPALVANDEVDEATLRRAVVAQEARLAAFVRRAEAAAAELTELMGAPAYDELVRHCDAHVASRSALAIHPASR